jgi:hypothetical protein
MKHMIFLVFSILFFVSFSLSDDGDAFDDGRVSVSPDGEKIAFSYKKNERTDIFLYDSSSARVKRLTKSDKKQSNLDPSFSPGGAPLRPVIQPAIC